MLFVHGSQRFFHDPCRPQQRSDALQQRVHFDRFHHEGVVRIVGAARTVLVRVRRNHHDPETLQARCLAQGGSNFPARHVRHGDVDHGEIRLALGSERQPRCAVVRGEYAEIQGLQQCLHDIQVRSIVIDEQNVQPPAFVARDDAGGRGYLRIGSFREQQHHGERRAFARRAARDDLAAHDLREQLGDREPKPSAWNSPHVRRTPALERFEDLFDLLRRNAHAGIGDLEFRHLAAIAHDQARVTFLRVLDCVR